MSVAETRARIVIDSNNAQHSLEALTRSMGAFSRAMGSSGNSMQGISSGAKKVSVDVKTLTESIVSAEGALRSLDRFSNAIGAVFKGAYDYSTNLESNAVGISGILMSMTKLNNQTLQWGQALSVSKDIMKELRVTALQTASTAPELIDTFRALLGPAMGTGMNVSQVMELTTVGVNAVKSMGLGGVQLVQELRSIIQGSIKPASSTLATALGISNADVKNAIKSSEGLFNYLMKKLQGFKMSVTETSKTIKGRIDILTEALYQSVEAGGSGTFEAIRTVLKDLSDKMLVLDKQANKFSLNPQFVEQIEKVSAFVSDLIKTVGSAGTSLLNNMGGITEATVDFLKWELYLGGGGLLITGIGKFKDLLLQAGQLVSNVANSLLGVEGKQARLNALEQELVSGLDKQKASTKVIDDYNKSVLKSIEAETKEQDKLYNIAEKYKKLLNDNVSGVARLNTNQHYDAINNIVNMRLAGNKAGLQQNDVESFISKYIAVYEKYGAKHAETYVTAFKNGLKQYSLGADIKALMNKSTDSLSTKDVSSLVSARNSLIRNSANFDPNLLLQLNEADKAFASLSATMQKAGISQNAITEAYINNIRATISASGDLTKVEKALTAEKIRSYEAELIRAESYKKAIGALSALGGALTVAGFAYQTLGLESDTALGKMMEWSIKAGTIIGAIAQIGGAYKELATIVKDLGIKEAVLKAIQLGMLHPGAALALLGSAIVLGTAWRVNEQVNDYNKNGVKNLSTDDGMQLGEAQEDELQTAMKSINDQFKKEKYSAMDLLKGESAGLQKYDASKYVSINRNSLSPYDGGGGAGSDSSKGANVIEKLKQQASSAQDAYKVLVDTITNANNKLNGGVDKYAEKQGEVTKKVDAWKKSFNDMVAKGGQYSKFTEEQKKAFKDLIAEFERLNKLEIENQRIKDSYENGLQHIQNMQDLGNLTTQQASKQRAEYLRGEIEFLQSRYREYENDANKRIELETEITNKIKALREAELMDGQLHWDRINEHIANTSFNLTETFNSGFDTILGRFTDFGQNIIGNTKSVTEQLKELCKNLTSDILNMMMKIYMQGLMMNLIGSIFPSGGAGSRSGTKMATASFWEDVDIMGIGKKAKGGYASGWNIVGERGPELVNFSNPARVYTADQTRNALSGNGGVNIKIDLHNESGQQMQAETTGSSFDGESYVVGVVLKAISTNKNGMRNIIKGVATT